MGSRPDRAPVLVNFGGDLRCCRRRPGDGAWQVGVESIAQCGAGRAPHRTEIRRARDQRRCTALHRDRRASDIGHVLDARTGWPVPRTPRSVTVAADTCSQAGSYSTLAMLQGEGAEAFLEAEGVRYWCLR